MAQITGTSAGETLNGTSAGDIIDGLGGNDTLNGLGGDDILDGGDNEDTMNGGEGNDELRSRSGFDSANGGAGTDTLVGDFSTATQSVFNEVGPTANNTLGGFDGTYLESGVRRLGYTSVERFVITTGSGADSITTGSGNDIVRTGAGNDLVNVGSGIDTADGGDGVDGLSADFSADPAGVDIDLRNAVSSGAFGSFSNFEYFINVTGSAFNDRLIGSEVSPNGSQTINLGAGDDTGGVGRGGGTVNGGVGNDTLIVDFSTATVGVFNEEGPLVNTALGGFNGSFLHTVRASYTSIERFEIATGSGNDTITTATGDDVIRTGAGNDRVNAGDGMDLVDGGAGDDILDGGAGSFDTVSFASATAGVTVDLRIAAAQNTVGAGTDTIVNFERLVGSAFADTLTGTTGPNWLDGGTGADTMTGLGGSDDYYVDNVGDVVIEEANGGVLDQVFTTLASYTLGANIEVLKGLSDTGQTLIGNALDNAEIRGGGGNDTIRGEAGTTGWSAATATICSTAAPAPTGWSADTATTSTSSTMPAMS
jgi:serralysin